jgi:hypothetical protein
MFESIRPDAKNALELENMKKALPRYREILLGREKARPLWKAYIYQDISSNISIPKSTVTPADNKKPGNLFVTTC